MKEGLLVAGGCFHAAFALFHLGFWRLFDWKRELRALGPVNRALVPVLNLCLTFVFVAFAYLSVAYRSEMLATGLGRSLIALISLFWLLRAVEQVVYFGFRRGLSVVFFVVFLLGSALYAAALS